tara:strand:- start:833 stop:1126 length:294 start_codon:yes stop_codon:yes gene_type:complete
MKKDKTKEIMDQWYSAMQDNKISVQPKASTILGTILAQYNISDKEDTKDIWAEFLTVTGGQLSDWYESLSEEDMKLFQKQRDLAKKTFHSDRGLLKG